LFQAEGRKIDGGMKMINDGSEEMKDADKNKMTLRWISTGISTTFCIMFVLSLDLENKLLVQIVTLCFVVT